MSKLIKKQRQFNNNFILYNREGSRLIPKAQFGTGLVKRGLRWISNHTAPTREQTMFEVQNEQRKEVERKREEANKSRTAADLQRDLIKYGYLPKGQDDGVIGPKTRQAINNAKADGYTIDMNTFTVKGNGRNRNLGNSNSQQNSGRAITVHYPNFVSHAGASGVFGNRYLDAAANVIIPDDLEVGHTGVILLDRNNNATYYEYGRYNEGNIIGKKLQGKGNWRKFNLPKIGRNENVNSYLARVYDLLPDKSENRMQFIVTNNVDYDKAVNYITTQANSNNRKNYSASNTCATQAKKVIENSVSDGKHEHKVQEGSDMSGSNWNSFVPGGSHQYFNSTFLHYGDYAGEVKKNN